MITLMWKEQKGKGEAKNDMDRSYKERHDLFIGKRGYGLRY